MKFTIRDLFLVTVIVALTLGWCIDHWQPYNRVLRLELRSAAMEIALEHEGFEVVQDGWAVNIYSKTDPHKHYGASTSFPEGEEP